MTALSCVDKWEHENRMKFHWPMIAGDLRSNEMIIENSHHKGWRIPCSLCSRVIFQHVLGGGMLSVLSAVSASSIVWNACMCVKLLRLCPPLCDPMDCSPPGSTVYGALQARILESVAWPSPRGSSQPRVQTHVSYISCIGRWFPYH